MAACCSTAGVPNWARAVADLPSSRASLASKSTYGDEQGGGTVKDLTITLEDRPGRLADLGEATGKAALNIEGMCATSGGGTAELHVLVEDAVAAREALGSAGIDVDAESDVLVIDVENRPGTMGEVARRVADAGVNIRLAYAAFGGVKLVLGVDDLDRARSAL
jgi:hypothetical protein